LCSRIERTGSRIRKSKNLSGSAAAPPSAGIEAGSSEYSSDPRFVARNSDLDNPSKQAHGIASSQSQNGKTGYTRTAKLI
jgi:hypothetical protein